MVHYSGKKDDWDEMSRAGMEGWSHTIMAHYMAKLKGKQYRKEILQVRKLRALKETFLWFVNF